MCVVNVCMYTAAVGDENPPIPISARLHRRRLWNADSRQLDGSGRSSLGHQCSRSTRLYYGARALCLTRITNNNNPPLKTKTKYADPLSFLFYVWSFLSILKKKKKIVFFFVSSFFFPIDLYYAIIISGKAHLIPPPSPPAVRTHVLPYTFWLYYIVV